MGSVLRLLIVLAGVWLVVHFVRQALARRRHRRAGEEDLRRRPPPRRIPRMLRCDRCGTYIPESEAITHRGKTYCCEAHLREDRL